MFKSDAARANLSEEVPYGTHFSKGYWIIGLGGGCGSTALSDFSLI
jgi:hypothetical protein